MALTTAYLVGLQNATRDALNAAPGGTFVLPFSAACVKVPVLSLAAGDVDTLQVLVCPGLVSTTGTPMGNSKKLIARKNYQATPWIDIGILQKVADETDPLIEQLMLLADQMYEFLLTKSVYGAFAVCEATNDPPYDPTKLLQAAVFQSILTLHFGTTIQLP